MKVLFMPGGPPEATDARVEGPARHLAARGHFIMAEVGRFWLEEERARGTKLVVLQRPSLPAHVQVLRACRSGGLATIVDVDVPPPRPGEPAVAYVDGAPPADPMAIAACLREADLVTVPTQALARLLEGRARRIEVLPDGYDDRAPAWTEARRRVQARRDRPEGTRPETVWFAVMGNADAYDDVATIASAVDQALDSPAGKHAGLLVIGDSLLQDAFLVPYERRRVQAIPDPEQLPLALAEADVLLAPHVDTRAHRVGSPRSVLLAAGAALPVVAARTDPASALVQSGQNGYLARSHQDWVRAVTSLAASADERQRCGERLYATVGTGYAWSRLVEQWERVFQSAT